MSMYNVHVPEPAEHNYHQARQDRRVERAFARIEADDVIATVEATLAQEADPKTHPLYGLTLFLLDRATACDGGQLYDDWRRRVRDAINVCLDEQLARGED